VGVTPSRQGFASPGAHPIPSASLQGCGGAMKVIACIEDPIVIKQILDHLKHKAETSGTRALPESRAPPAELLLGLFD